MVGYFAQRVCEGSVCWHVFVCGVLGGWGALWPWVVCGVRMYGIVCSGFNVCLF